VGIRCTEHVTYIYPQKLALTLPTSGDRSVDVVRLRTKATESGVYFISLLNITPTIKALEIDIRVTLAVGGEGNWSAFCVGEQVTMCDQSMYVKFRFSACICRSQWLRSLRHEMSSPAQTLESWIGIPLEAWLSACVYSVCVALCR
jgi:hypothetical protein